MKKKHVHKYVKKNLTRSKSKPPFFVYACILPDCTHYLSEELVLGKENICHRCGSVHKIKKLHFRIPVKPHCDKCTEVKPNTKERKKKIEDIMDVLHISELLKED